MSSKQLLKVFVHPTILHSDNKVVLHVAADPIFHEHIKHIELKCYFVCEHLLFAFIKRCHRYFD